MQIKKTTMLLSSTLFMFLFLSTNAHSSAIVLGSQYDYYLGDNGGTDINTVTFDGVDETYNNITISEKQTSIGNNQYVLAFSFFSLSDIFDGDDRGLSGVGTFNSLDLNGMFNYVSGSLMLHDTDGLFVAAYGLGTEVNNPWNGSNPNLSRVWVLPPAIDNTIGRIDYSFTIERVPEPTTLLLITLGLVAFGRTRLFKK